MPRSDLPNRIHGVRSVCAQSMAGVLGLATESAFPAWRQNWRYRPTAALSSCPPSMAADGPKHSPAPATPWAGSDCWGSLRIGGLGLARWRMLPG